MNAPLPLDPPAPAVEPLSVDGAAIDALVAWMIDGARPSADARQIVDTICRGLVAAGVPVDRVALFINTLHPNSVARRLVWTPDGGVDVTEGPLGLFAREVYLRSPIPVVTAEQTAIRRRLTDPAARAEFIILGELRDEGFTDYLAVPLVFTTGDANAATFSTRHERGFAIDAIDAIELVRRPLARLVETYLLRLNAATILSAYVGRGGGERILQGGVHRGDGEEIEAAILFTDLIGFTDMSNALSGSEIVAILNEAFDVVVPPVEAHGGEILKFLGDGFFAIFPHGGRRSLPQAVRSASEAVLEGEQKLAATPLGERIAFRSAVHTGRFHYGNIGGANRLDFTAIGRPVNYAARLVQAASALSLRRVASADVAGQLCVPPQLVAEVPFKGFDGLQKVYSY